MPRFLGGVVRRLRVGRFGGLECRGAAGCGPPAVLTSDRSSAFSDEAKLFKTLDTYAVGNIFF